jgi:HK97 gp10 family phage protein
MAEISAKVDVSSALAGLQRLGGENRTHLARSMAVAGGKVLRDEVKAFVPVHTGRLKESIYLAFKDTRSTADHVIYSVTWRKGRGQMGGGAPHGHLVEFGHWQTHKAYIGSDGQWYSTQIPLANPKWIAAHPFMRPGFEAGHARAQAAMFERGRVRLHELLAEQA